MPNLLTDIVNHADVGMIERRSSLCFPLDVLVLASLSLRHQAET